MRVSAFLIAIAALAVSFYTLHRLSNVEAVREEGRTGSEEAHGEEMEIAVHMGRIQRHHQKWWAAGRAGNAELAAFYLHEMGEEMEAIAAAGVMEEGIDVSAQMRAHALPVVRQLERQLAEEGVAAAHGDAALLVSACNNCHAATGYPFIRIRVPSGVAFPDQDFEPVP